MSTKKTTKANTATKAAKAATPRKGKAKDFPRIAEALTAPLPAPTSEAKSDAAVRRHADAGHTSVRDDKPAKGKKAKATKEPKAKKVSALDAAARVLEETGEPMTCKAMIEAMAAKGYWSTPGGKTPEATLYSAILREVAKKGDTSRFQKTERGKFASAGAK